MKLWKYVLAILVGMILCIVVLLFWLDYRESRAVHGEYGSNWQEDNFEVISFPESNPNNRLSLLVWRA